VTLGGTLGEVSTLGHVVTNVNVVSFSELTPKAGGDSRYLRNAPAARTPRFVVSPQHPATAQGAKPKGPALFFVKTVHSLTNMRHAFAQICDTFT